MKRNDPKKRVLFVDHTASLGGGEIALLNVVANLDRGRYEPIVLLFSNGPLTGRLAEAVTEVHVLSLNERIVMAKKDGLGVATLMRLPEVISAVAFVWRLRRFIRDHHIDLVHTNSLKADVLGGLATRLARVPLIWHIRDRIDADYLPRHVVYVFRWLCRLLPDFVIANSAATLSTIGLDQPDRGVAIPSGIDLRSRVVHDGMNSSDSDDSTGQQQPNTHRMIGLVGRISPWKGQHIFLQAAARVYRRFPDVRFQIIGNAMFNEQDYEREIRQLCTDLSLDKCVEFMGFRDDVSSLVNHMEILVHASVTAEPFGQVVTEGMAAGKPVVATAGGGVLEIVVDGITGLLVPMGDSEAMSSAICQLLDDPQAARRMGEMGRQRVVEQFTIKTTVAKIERVYDDVLAARTMTSRGKKRHAGFHAASALGAATTLAIVGVTFGITEGLRWKFGERAPLSALFVCAVAISAELFGVWAGLLAMASSLAAMDYVLRPKNSWAIDKGYEPVLALFAIVSLVLMALIARLRRAEGRARAAQLVAEKARHDSEFIARASAAFAMSPDRASLLKAVGRLATSALCDWCIIDLVSENLTNSRAFVTHRDVTKFELAQLLFEYPPAMNSEDPAAKAIRSQAAVCLDEIAGKRGLNPELEELLVKLGPGPAIVVPLNTGGRTLGAISLVRCNSNQPYGAPDLKLATEFAWRPAIALERSGQATLDGADLLSLPRAPSAIVAAAV